MSRRAAGSSSWRSWSRPACSAHWPPSVFARAYGFAFPAAIAGIVAGSLVAAPLAALFGVRGAFVALGALTALYTLTLVRRPEPVAAPAPAAV